MRLAEEYEEARVAAEADHAELCAFLRAANEQLTEEARRRFQEAIQEVQVRTRVGAWLGGRRQVAG